jgi:hypothetical protein
MQAATSGKLLTLVALFSLLAGSSTAFGAVILHDSFSHPDGNLTGNPPEIGGVWTTHSGTTAVTVASGQAKLTQANSEDTHSNFSTGPIGAGSQIYAGFQLTVPSQANPITAGYFAHFKDVGNFFGTRIWIAPPTAGGYKLVLSGDNSITDADGEVAWPVDLAFDQPYCIMSSYNYDTGETKMWVDPLNELSPSVTATDSFAGDEFESYSLRQFSAGAGTSMQLIDNLTVATTFNEARCIPEPATIALVVLAGMALLGLGRRSVR